MPLLFFPSTTPFLPSFVRYLNSPSTRFGLFIGLLMYTSYGYAHNTWANPALIGVTAFIGLCLPSYARLSNKLEEKTNHRTALVTAGRVARFAAQFAFNLL